MDHLSALHSLIGAGHDITWWQMSVRAVVVFLFGLLMIRLFGRHAFGEQSALDIVVAILIGSNLSRAVTGSGAFLSVLLATGVIIVCYWAMDHTAARHPRFSHITKGRPLPLFRDGRPDRELMRKAGVSEGDLMEALRATGSARLDEVKDAYLERNGEISVLSDTGEGSA